MERKWTNSWMNGFRSTKHKASGDMKDSQDFVVVIICALENCSEGSAFRTNTVWKWEKSMPRYFSYAAYTCYAATEVITTPSGDAVDSSESPGLINCKANPLEVYLTPCLPHHLY
ncbi:hypothetical protein RJ641_028411 [Dillenia turbinata]|uniref:Uncharacterized protein n=1 Tax=Dillenia turbinata TaxID=194707 RepID=A0AAN8ZJ06_9MAGN